MNLGKMEKFSIAYNILLYIFLKPLHNLMWYKKVHVAGKENLKKDKSYIFTPNHQNALMDALAFVANCPFQIVWLARADIFKSNIAKFFLRFMRIMPIFRQRDGAHSLAQNDEIFNKSITVLENKFPLALFPETTHWGFRKLRSTKKAVPRIAFLAEEKNNFNLNIHIVPCGLYYEEYQPARSNILIQYGTPFPVKEYIELCKENENKGYQALRLRIEEEIRPLIIDIQTEEFYETFNDLRGICDTDLIKLHSIEGKFMIKKFKADKLLIDKLMNLLNDDISTIQKLKESNDRYRDIKNKYGLNENILKSDLTNFHFIIGVLRTILLFPVFIIGAFFHFIPYYFPQKLTKRIVKDPQFVSSFNFALSFLLYPLFHLIYLILIFNFTDLSWWSIFIIIPVLCITAVVAIDYYNSTKRLIQKIEVRLKKGKNSEIDQVLKLRNEIKQTVLSFWEK